MSLLAISLAAAAAPSAAATNWLPLPVVRPVTACQRLIEARLAQDELVDLKLSSAKQIGTPRGRFCKVQGTIGPGTIGFNVYLPVDRWTQRYVQAAQNVLPIPRGGSNQPALRAEVAVAITDKGGAG